MNQTIEKATVLFAGDSGDGMQLTGFQFSNTSALHGNDLSTFPDFPAEIRAPIGTVAGVSGFKINFGSVEINTPGGKVDTLVAMNAAALVKFQIDLKSNGMIIANINGFDKRNLRLAGLDESRDLLSEARDAGFHVVEIEITKLTREALKDSGLSTKEQDRSKNMFTLGLVYWLYNREIERSLLFLKEKFKSKPDLLMANTKVLKTGYHFGETIELFSNRYTVNKASLPAGSYRNIAGNEAIAIGLISAAAKAHLDLFYAGYPITPASDILHELANRKNYGVRSFQAEDEIAAIGAAVGASFAGSLAVTASSGPGIALKTEALGLAFMLETPLVVINVQRGGPSTGLPTKTEQSDLFQAIYGRNGEAPIPVIAARSPKDCFAVAFEACRIAIEHMTPVILLSDGYIANGSEPWRFPKASDLAAIHPNYAKMNEAYLPYERDARLVRSWAIPGTAGHEYRLGGLEKEDRTGNVSYEPENHQKMVLTRAAKVNEIAHHIPPQEIDCGPETGDVLIVGWGSTYGAIRTAVLNMNKQGISVAHLHIRYLFPFPMNLEKHLRNFKTVIIPELNNGQLVKIIREKFLINAIPLNKIKGLPFLSIEIEDAVKEQLKG